MNIKELNCICSEKCLVSLKRLNEKPNTTKKDLLINKKTDYTKQDGVYYPLDIWFILANYIKPEQIQTFSCLCRGSYLAVTSVKFWTQLYKRFITDTENLPICLTPNGIANKPGVKTRIVRALFLAHPNLNKRLGAEESLEMADKVLQQLIGLRCRNTWYKIESTSNSSHTYLFRFQLGGARNDEIISKSDDTSRTQDFLRHNHEENYLVLQVKVRGFTRVHFTEHAVLLDFSMDANLTSLTMVFGCSKQETRHSKEESIVIKSVSAIKLLRWWHPSYPHRD
jgi:hypothetical protein